MPVLTNRTFNCPNEVDTHRFNYKGDIKVSISHTQTHAVAFAILKINS